MSKSGADYSHKEVYILGRAQRMRLSWLKKKSKNLKGDPRVDYLLYEPVLGT